MAEKPPPQLHELLKEDQEPFHLKTYIANKQSQLKSSTSLSLRKRRPIFHETPTKRHNLCKHACFLSLAAASPFPDLPSPSPAKSPCKSPNAAVFLHIPSRTASILVEAAMRIQKQNHRSKPKPPPRTGFGLLGSFLKRLKDRTKNRKRAIHDSTQQQNQIGDETARMSSCSCSAAVDLEASTSSRVDDEICADFYLLSDDDDESCFCASPFTFSLHQSPSSAGRRTPEFCSPPPSPTRRGMQEKENSENVQAEEEEKEQCSPVSVLDPLFDEDEEHESPRADEEDEDDDDDYDMECSYENVQRAKQQLLHRLRRFEKLAELDPVELEKKLLMEEGQVEREEALSADMKRLVSDLIVEEKVQSGGSEVVMGRICNRLDSWKEVEFDTIDMMIGLDFKKEIDGIWTKCGQQVQETAAEIEGGIYLVLIQELTEELLI